MSPSVGSPVGGASSVVVFIVCLCVCFGQGSGDPDEERTQPSRGLVESGSPDVRHAHRSGQFKLSVCWGGGGGGGGVLFSFVVFLRGQLY